MDIALCSLSGKNLQYAGAHIPLWIIRDGEVLIIEPNKQPISKSEILSTFNTHAIELKQNDTIYIFSDGFPDQYGGEKGKKYKARKFKAFLLSIQVYEMEQQKLLLDDEFESWKLNYEQTDDVCVIGIRI